MTVIPPQRVQISCPNCSTTFQTDILTIVDVTNQPELKQALLTGRLNVASCPTCGLTSMLGVPLLYHDASKELALVYIPTELNMPADQQEQLIGEYTGLIMQTLPSNAPRGYLLTPRRVMSLASLIDNVLEADGIPKEVLEEQRKRVEIITAMAQVVNDEAALNQLIEQHRAAITPEFMATVEAFLSAGPASGNDESVQVLSMLRDTLIARTGVQPATGSTSDVPVDTLVEQLLTADDEQLSELVAEHRHDIDYSFFQALTARIEQAEASGDTATATQLTTRRTTILDMIEQMDQEAQALFEAASQLLQEAIAADDPRAVLAANSNRIDEAFLLLLSSNVTAAERAGQSEMAQRLQTLQEQALAVLEEAQTPEERLINQLLRLETPAERATLLRQHTTIVTPAFVKQVNEMAGEHNANSTDIADQLRQIGREAGAMLY